MTGLTGGSTFFANCWSYFSCTISNIHYMIQGNLPLSAEFLLFLKIAFCSFGQSYLLLKLCPTPIICSHTQKALTTGVETCAHHFQVSTGNISAVLVKALYLPKTKHFWTVFNDDKYCLYSWDTLVHVSFPSLPALASRCFLVIVVSVYICECGDFSGVGMTFN